MDDADIKRLIENNNSKNTANLLLLGSENTKNGFSLNMCS